MIVDALKIGVVVFVAAVVQTAVFSGMSVLGGEPDVLLVTLVAVALVRGATAGAFAGFFAGLVVASDHGRGCRLLRRPRLTSRSSTRSA